MREWSTDAVRAHERFSYWREAICQSIFNLDIEAPAGPFSARVSYAFRGEYLEEIGDEAAYDIYVRESEQLDLTASYRINDHLEVMIQAKNLLNDPLELYQGTAATTLQFEEYGSTYAFAIKGRF